MISPKIDSAATAPATLVSLRRSGIAGLSMARLTGRFERVLDPVVLPRPVRAVVPVPPLPATPSLLRA